MDQDPRTVGLRTPSTVCSTRCSEEEDSAYEASCYDDTSNEWLQLELFGVRKPLSQSFLPWELAPFEFPDLVGISVTEHW